MENENFYSKLIFFFYQIIRRIKSYSLCRIFVQFQKKKKGPQRYIFIGYLRNKIYYKLMDIEVIFVNSNKSTHLEIVSSIYFFLSDNMIILYITIIK